MKRLPHLSLTPRPRSQQGVALIIVLSLIVLLAGLVIAYFSRSSTDLQVSQTSASQIKADLLAQSAGEIIIGDLRQEIMNGDRITLSSGTFYASTSGSTWAPLRDGTIPNLVRMSHSSLGSPAVATGYSAAAISSTFPSINGRAISAERWNAHFLLPQFAAGSNATPITAFIPPKWIPYVSGSGPLALTTPTNTVIGRYAYAIYDEGGLLDINVAGSPVASGTNAKGRKGSVAYALLSSLPGNAQLSGALADKVIAWRNYSTSHATGNSFADYVISDGSYYDAAIANGTNGFMKVYGSDQQFTSRQSLVKFWKEYNLPMSSLQYFTTYSRALEQPSLTGTYGLPGTAAAQDAAVNPNFLSSVTTAGVPKVDKRFPLSNLAWLTYKGPSVGLLAGDPLRVAMVGAGVSDAVITSGSAQNISEKFGLTWNNGAWRYATATIAPLSSISGEPNFFELLKATIPVGVLGKGTGIITGYQSWQNARDADRDRAIFQIGANIIDQYDIDAYPTRIQFGTEEVQGVEDLPYLNGVRMGVVNIENAVGTGIDSTKSDVQTGLTLTTPGKGAVILMPEVWRPQRRAIVSGSYSPRPTQFRFSVSSGTGTLARDVVVEAENNGTFPPASAPGIDATKPLNADDSYVLFEDANVTDYQDPTLLLENGVPANNGLAIISGSTDSLLKTAFGSADGITSLSSSGTFMGVYLGKFPMKWNDESVTPNKIYSTIKVKVVPSAGVDALLFELSYNIGTNAVPDWVPYDQKKAPVFGTQDVLWGSGNGRVGLTSSNTVWGGVIDPRTGHFGMGIGSGTASAANAANVVPTLRPNAGSGVSLDYGSGWYTGTPFYPGSLSENRDIAPISDTYYADRDGVARPAMGVYTSGTNALPMSGLAAARPTMLNRPFRSVAELGYVFSGIPWRQLDMAHPKSGFARLLDVFSLNENDNPHGLTAGKVNLNTRQVPVLAAIIDGIFQEEDATVVTTGSAIAQKLVDRTKGTKQLGNISDLVGRWNGGTDYDGLMADIGGISGLTTPELARTREAALRALVNAGQTRVWNLMIDVVAQTGRYPLSVTTLDKFQVEGEQRYWIHVAIDRLTGKVIDKQIEVVRE